MNNNFTLNLSKSSVFFPSAKFTLFFSDQIGSVTSGQKVLEKKSDLLSGVSSIKRKEEAAHNSSLTRI